jgi:hypothetical protein
MYRSKILKMDLLTTKAQDFTPHKLNPTRPDKYRPPEHNMRFTAKTHYQADYPNWGPYEVLYMKHFNVPTRSDMLKTNSQTTYRTNFKPGHLEPVSEEMLRQKYDRLYKSKPMATTDVFYGETTARKYFIDPRKSNIRSQLMQIRQDPLQFAVHDCHFKSSYETDFNQKALQPGVPTRRMLETSTRLE